jgi:hypothetical protein
VVPEFFDCNCWPGDVRGVERMLTHLIDVSKIHRSIEQY